MPDKNENIEIRSDEVQEIIGKSPSWLLRSGLTVVLAFVLLLLAGGWLFKYPDIIRARIVVLSENPPAHIVGRTTGKIDQLFVADKDTVKRDQLIAILENAANHEDVLQLQADLKLTDRFFITFDTLYFKELNVDYRLGDIQADFSSFLNNPNIVMKRFAKVTLSMHKVFAYRCSKLLHIMYDYLYSVYIRLP